MSLPKNAPPRGLTTYYAVRGVCDEHGDIVHSGKAFNLKSEVDARLAEGQRADRWDTDLQDYRNALGGDGPHAAEWADKPHRLVYDLCEMVQQLREKLAEGAQEAEKARKNTNVLLLAMSGHLDKVTTERGYDGVECVRLELERLRAEVERLRAEPLRLLSIHLGTDVADVQAGILALAQSRDDLAQEVIGLRALAAPDTDAPVQRDTRNPDEVGTARGDGNNATDY